MKGKLPMFFVIVVSFLMAIVSCQQSSNPAEPEPTATSTPTPGEGAVEGSMTSLAGDQLNKYFGVILDSDLNIGNGTAEENESQCTTSSSSEPFAVTAPAGTYYMYAAINMDGQHGPPTPGDYVGVYGAAYPAFPASPNVTVPDGSTNTGMDIVMVTATANTWGSIVLPGSVSGSDYVVIVDTDTSGDNEGFAAMHYGNVTGTAINFEMLTVFPGDFYVYGFVDVDHSGLDNGPNAGDYIAFYGGVDSPVTYSFDPAESNGPINMTATAMP